MGVFVPQVLIVSLLLVPLCALFSGLTLGLLSCAPAGSCWLGHCLSIAEVHVPFVATFRWM